MIEGNRKANRSTARGLAWLAVLCLVAGFAPGCVTTTTTGETEPSVTRAVAKRDLGIDYLSTGRTAMAIRELRAAVELDPGDAQTQLWLGEAYRRKGQRDQAEALFRKAVTLAERRDDAGTAQEAKLNLSALLAQMGRYEASLEYCEALAIDPTLSTPWRPLTNCGWSLMQLGRHDEARAKLFEALDYFPRFGPALLNLGILEAKEGHRLASIKFLERALAGRLSGAGKAEANYRLGELYVALGRRDKAVVHFTAAVEAAPNIDWGSQSQAYLDLLR